MLKALLVSAITVAATVTGASAPASADVPCWTSFNPSAPQGGPMTHYYKNCNSGTIRVATGFVDGTGQISTYVTSCADVGVGQVQQWFYEDGTTPGVNYQTIICYSTLYRPIVRPAASSVPCWTTFLPPNPNGGPMLHRYKNCNSGPISVGHGKSDGTGQITLLRETCRTVQPGEEFLVDYQQTTQGTNYHTVICRN